MKLKLFLLTALTILLLPGFALADDVANFSIRLGQPKSPTNQNNFKLTFVALDTVESGRQITVKCFKKTPADGGFSQFDTDKVMIPGGNTDYCNVTDSLVNSEGSYSFYVTATTDGTTLTSSTVNVDYNVSGPSTPSDYSKERLNSCDYKIKFKTANDGKTVKVQLFRSDTLNISVNSGSVLSSVNIGPNQEGSITNSVPQCGKDYYYAIRAVDGSDNVSGTAGDSFTTTSISSTVISAQAEINLGAPDSGAITLNGATSGVARDGLDAPAEDASVSGTTDADGNPVSATPSILGTSTESKWTFKKWLALIGTGFIFYFVLKAFLAEKSNSG